MSDQNGNGPKIPKVFQPYVITVYVEDGFESVDFAIKARGQRKSGIVGSWLEVPASMGVPVDQVLVLFGQLANSGSVVQRKILGEKPVLNDQGEEIGKEPVFEVNDAGEFIRYPINGYFELVAPPQAEQQPASRIIAL